MTLGIAKPKRRLKNLINNNKKNANQHRRQAG